jgi:hypothetical protein
MKRLLAAMGLLVSVSVLAPALARTGTGHVTRCYANCPVQLTGCRDTFIKGRFYRDCVKRVVYACRHAGGCGAVMPPPPTDRCRGGVFCPLGRPVCDTSGWKCVLGGGTCPASYPVTCSGFCCPAGDTCAANRSCCPSGHPVDCGTYCCTNGGVCGQGGCVAPPTGPPTLPPGNYNVTICVSGTISLPCTPVGTFPVSQLPAFEQAMQGAISQFLAAGGAGGCSIGAGQATAAGGGVDVNFSATCTDPSGASASETVLLEVRP